MSAGRPNSNSAISATYKQKLEHLRREYEFTAPFRRSRVVRQWISRQLGCHPSFLSTPKAAKFLKEWDLVRSGRGKVDPLLSRLDANADTGPSTSLDEVAIERIRRGQARKLRDGIEWGEARIGKRTRLCPWVTFNNEFQTEIYDWQCLRVKLDLPDTLWDSAKIMLQFFRWLRRKRIQWPDVDDDYIIEFREELRSKRTGKARINKILSVLHSFYRRQESVGRLRYRVQIYAPDALPAEMLDYEFPIKSELRTRTSKHGAKTSNWSSPWLLKGRESSYGKKYTPTDADLGRVHQKLHGRRHGVRDSTIISAVDASGGRRREILAIKVTQLPSIIELDRLLTTGGKWTIYVTCKGQDEQNGETAPLRFDAPVIMRMVSYANGPRAKIVSKTGSKVEELFLKDDGQVLKPDSLSKLVTKVLRESGVLNSTLHKVRSKFIKRRIKGKLDLAREHAANIGPASNWTETILSGAAIDMNQSDIASLKPYIDDIFAEETANGGPQTLADVEEKIREAKLLYADLGTQLSVYLAFDRIIKQVERSPRKDEILKRLAVHAEELLQAG